MTTDSYGIENNLTSPPFPKISKERMAAHYDWLERWTEEQKALGGRIEGGVWVYDTEAPISTRSGGRPAA